MNNSKVVQGVLALYAGKPVRVFVMKKTPENIERLKTFTVEYVTKFVTEILVEHGSEPQWSFEGIDVEIQS